MKDPKDVEKLFSKVDEQLTQRPSARAWDKLNEKLEQHDQAERMPKVVPLTRRFPAWQIAASLLLLIGLFTFATRQLSDKEMPMADASGKIFLEDVPIEEDVNGFYALAVKCTQYYNTSPSGLMADNRTQRSRLRLTSRSNRYASEPTGFDSTGEKPLAANTPITLQDSTGGQIAQADIEPAELLVSPESGFAKNEYKASPSTTADANVSAATAVENVDDYMADEESIAELDEVKEANVADYGVAEDQVEYASATMPEESAAEEVTVQSSRAQDVQPTDRMSKAKRTKKRNKEAEETIALNATRNVMIYDEDDKDMKNGALSSFQWLIGQWEAQSDQQQVQQNWIQKDEFTLEGKAVFSVNGEEIQVQKMEITKGENGIYFILANLTDNTTQKYQLKSMEAYQAIFAGQRNDEFIIHQLDNNQFNNFTKQFESQSILNNNATPFNNLNFNRVNKE